MNLSGLTGERGRHHETKLGRHQSQPISHRAALKGFEALSGFLKHWRCGGGPSEIRDPHVAL